MISTLILTAVVALMMDLTLGAMALSPSLGLGLGSVNNKVHGPKIKVGEFTSQRRAWGYQNQNDQHEYHSTTTTTTTTLCASKNGAREKQSPKTSATAVDLTSLRRLVSQSSELHDKNLDSSTSYEQVQSRLTDLEMESSDPAFWDASNSQRNEAVTREIARYAKLKEEMELWSRLREDAEGALEMLEELLAENSSTEDDGDEEMIAMTSEECQSCASQLLELSQKHELTTLLSGPYDASNCRLILTAGAGGTEACDWVSMLYRMYSRHASHMDMKITTCDENTSKGDVVGYKSVELLVEGVNAYGWFKGEKGAHRLVRLSPFNANNKRQTTFAGVDVIPVLEEEKLTEIDIPDKELEVTTMRSGGKGGQNVNKVETGVRIKHLPSGIAVKCTQERSQGMNKSLALGRLKAQLLAIAQEQQVQDIKAIRGDVVEASWGAQIRNYVMQPYKMVKDARGSSYETSDVDGVLDGGSALEEFVASWLRYTRAKEEKEREEMELEA